MDFSSLRNFDWKQAQDLISRNLGEIDAETLQGKLAATLAEKLGLTSDAQQSLIKGEAVQDEIGTERGMKKSFGTLQKLVKARTATPAGEMQEAKEAKEKLTKEQLLERTITTLRESSKMLMDIIQDRTYNMIDNGATAQDVYEVINETYARNPVNADRFLQKQISNLKNDAKKTTDPKELADLDNAVKVFQDAQKILYKERGRELQVDRATQAKAEKADAKFAKGDAAEVLYQSLLSAGTAQLFEGEILQDYDSFEEEIVPAMALLMHMASKEINQGQGQLDRAHLGETLKLVKNCQGLLSTFRANQEGMSTLWQSWATEITKPEATTLGKRKATEEPEEVRGAKKQKNPEPEGAAGVKRSVSEETEGAPGAKKQKS